MTLIIVALAAVTPLNVFAAKGDQGVDWAIYQGEQGRFGYAHDKFAIAQIGGYNASGIYEQYTYKTQVASAVPKVNVRIPIFGMTLGETWTLRKQRWIISCHVFKRLKIPSLL